jgi:hypothetical protein
MDDRRLSLREQRILAEIETELGRDRRLDKCLRQLRLPARLRALAVQRRLRGAELSLLIPTTLLLLLPAIRTASLGVTIACASCGLASVLLLLGAAHTRLERRRMERAALSGLRWTAPPGK